MNFEARSMNDENGFGMSDQNISNCYEIELRTFDWALKPSKLIYLWHSDWHCEEVFHSSRRRGTDDSFINYC